MTDPKNPTSRALRAIELLDTFFPGYTVQQAATELLTDLISLENEKPERLHYIGALEDAMNFHESIQRPLEAELIGETVVDQRELDDAIASGKVVDFSAARFEAGHKVKGAQGETPVA